MDHVHLQITTFYMRHVQLVPFFQQLNEIFSPRSHRFRIKIHFEETWIEVVIDFNNFFFTVPNLSAAVRSNRKGSSIDGVELCLLEKHSSHVLLFVLFGFFAWDFHNLNHGVEGVEEWLPVHEDVLRSSVEDAALLGDNLVLRVDELLEHVPLLSLLPVVEVLLDLLGR